MKEETSSQIPVMQKLTWGYYENVNANKLETEKLVALLTTQIINSDSKRKSKSKYSCIYP